MNNYDIAHNFFYQEGENFDKYYKSMSYNNDKFYSYGTIIAKKMIDKNGDKCLFLSANNFSNTTTKHINYLRQACPYYNILYVPVDYNQKDISIENTIESTTLSYYVLFKDNDVIGFFECSIISPEAELYDIVIDEKYQGLGYSKILMDLLT